MIADKVDLWTVILGLGLGTFLLRFSFLGMIGNRVLPFWALRLLRYTPMAVIPGLVAPAVMWPAATQGETDPARLLAVMATVGVAVRFRSVLGAMIAGGVTFYAALFYLG